MNTKSKFGLLLIAGIIAAFFGFTLAQEHSNAFYALGIAGLLAMIVGGAKLMGGTGQDR